MIGGHGLLPVNAIQIEIRKFKQRISQTLTSLADTVSFAPIAGPDPVLSRRRANVHSRI